MVALLALLATMMTAVDSVQSIERALVAQGGRVSMAPAVAAAVYRYSLQRNLPIDLIVGVIGVENRELAPRAQNKDGSVGLMQVQPFWRRSFAKSCGTDMTNVNTNVCMGTAVLAMNIKDTKTLRTALLRYNGCVKTPGCTKYADYVLTRMRKSAAVRADTVQ